MLNSAPSDFSNYSGMATIAGRYEPEPVSDAQGSKVLVVSYFNGRSLDFSEVYQSLRRQTFQNWKWLVCHDVNLDAQVHDALVAEVAGDARVSIREHAECAVTSTIWAQPEYIVLVDTSTRLGATFIEKALWCLASNPEFAFCNSFGVIHGAEDFLVEQRCSEGKYYLGNPQVKVRGMVVRTSALIEAFDDIAVLPDGRDPISTLTRLAGAGHWGFTIPEHLQWCRLTAVAQEAESVFAGFKKEVPHPHRRYPSAYETLPVEFAFQNPLKPNVRGRRVMFLLPWMVEGGADRVSIDLIEGLIAGGADVTVCATLEAEHRWEHKFAELTPDIFVLPNFLSLSDFPRFLLYLIASRGIDTVLITGSTLGYQLLPYLKSAAPETAFLDLSHTEEMHWLNGGHPRFSVGYQDALDINVVSTRHLAEWMAERGADQEKIRVMYTGIKSNPVSMTASERGDTLRRFDLDESALTIIFAGRMCDQKRPLKLAEILHTLKLAGVRFNALVIGDGELRPAFEGLIKDYELGDNVRVLGARPHAEWLSLLAVSDVLLMPSEYEGISVALLEAMAAGVVPVVADVGGQDELVGEEMGYLVAHGEDEVSRYVGVLQAVAADVSMRERKAQACKRLIAAHYTSAATNRQWLEILDEAHRNRIASSHPPLALGLAKELATWALESRRVTTYLDQIYATHCLTNDAQTEVSFKRGFIYLLVARVRHYRLGKYILDKPLTQKVVRRMKLLIS
ncbi:glycosyltransferase family 4 protein [Pseudomonas sp. 10S4]|uniref:glycosyltransferase family 4 protein n=1 Tax=Pseudomonas sp. 10S4 TaxID=3048583 RepID=UPI002AC997C4|nr:MULTISPECIES: glycosyltransferase family 4 protein [unclassified Pseudomonas]MEB0224700.1 glycosyltransferase family 4 protein [Pseudomonas sp. 5S1]MEB0295846.1 glycosyltransferase family 4 protein [Pseudomonas sp. 10S4]WPX18451.1 glycosyltransferase family 4 protein [Pseudomonas sp. 10S4]